MKKPIRAPTEAVDGTSIRVCEEGPASAGVRPAREQVDVMRMDQRGIELARRQPLPFRRHELPRHRLVHVVPEHIAGRPSVVTDGALPVRRDPHTAA